MNIIHKKRLLKLAEHLERGKLIHQRFNFNRWNANEAGEQLKTNGCGFAGCAIGECPGIFRAWGWKKGHPVLNKNRRKQDRWTEMDAEEWFGLTHDEVTHLFVPSGFLGDNQRPNRYGGRILFDTATPKQVARNIRAFIKKKEQATP